METKATVIEVLEGDPTTSVGVYPQADGTFLAMTHTKSKTFKTRGGADRWLERQRNPQARERGTGRYAFDGDFSRPCVCGHTLGDHTAERARNPETRKMEQPCIVHENPGNGHEGPACDCSCFKPAKVKP